MHQDLRQRQQQLVLDQIPRADRFVAHRQGIIRLRQVTFLVDARDQRQQRVGIDLVIECLQTALATQSQGCGHLATQHRPLCFITGKRKPEPNIAPRFHQRAPQPRQTRQGQTTYQDRATVYGSPRVQ